MSSPNGYTTDPDALDEAAKSIDALADQIAAARTKLTNEGELPTLDPLSHAMAVIGAAAGLLTGPFAPLVAPLLAVGGHDVGQNLAAAHDPYPPIRNAWLDELEKTYHKLLTSTAHRLRASADHYRRNEEQARRGLESAPHQR